MHHLHFRIFPRRDPRAAARLATEVENALQPTAPRRYYCFVSFLTDTEHDEEEREDSPSAGVSVTIRRHGEPEHGPLLHAVHRVVLRLDVEAVGDVPGNRRADDREPDEEAPEKPRRPHPVRWSDASLAAL